MCCIFHHKSNGISFSIYMIIIESLCIDKNLKTVSASMLRIFEQMFYNFRTLCIIDQQVNNCLQYLLIHWAQKIYVQYHFISIVSCHYNLVSNPVSTGKSILRISSPTVSIITFVRCIERDSVWKHKIYKILRSFWHVFTISN